jgi:3-oxoacyl-[acyl-carrier protein] reductase
MRDVISLAGKVAVVTGGARGIGLAISHVFAEHGAHVIINTRKDRVRAEDVASEIADKFGVKTAVIVGDVAHSQTSNMLVQKAFSMAKRLDIYVNNAGVLEDGLIGMIADRHIDSVIGTNLVGVIHGTQAAARVMRRSGGGSIINLSSIIGRVGLAGHMVYGASKAGVIGATLSAAKELAALNIRVNAIAPGFIETDMTAQLSSEKFEERVGSIAAGRIGKPEDAANAALFLASDLSNYMTGQILGVDGSMLI